VVCDVGYSGSGDATCTADGSLETATLLFTPCSVNSCSDAPSAPADGTVAFSATNDHDSVATFACNTGFTRSGDETVACDATTDDAAWGTATTAAACSRMSEGQLLDMAMSSSSCGNMVLDASINAWRRMTATELMDMVFDASSNCWRPLTHNEMIMSGMASNAFSCTRPSAITSSNYGTIMESSLAAASFSVTLVCASGYSSTGTPTAAACTSAGDYTVTNPCTVAATCAGYGGVDTISPCIGFTCYERCCPSACGNLCGAGSCSQGTDCCSSPAAGRVCGTDDLPCYITADSPYPPDVNCVVSAVPTADDCTASCEQDLTNAVTIPQSGQGTACEPLTTYACQPENGECPAAPDTVCVNDDSTTSEDGVSTCSSYYDAHPWNCGRYDDADFTASVQCCACGGGQRGSNPDYVAATCADYGGVTSTMCTGATCNERCCPSACGNLCGGTHGGATRCGAGWGDANGKCGTSCPRGTDYECSDGESCFADLDTSRCSCDQGTECCTRDAAARLCGRQDPPCYITADSPYPMR